MPEGKIKWFSEEKGYGFIESDDGKDIFFTSQMLFSKDILAFENPIVCLLKS